MTNKEERNPTMKMKTQIRMKYLPAIAALVLGSCVATGWCDEKPAVAKPQLAKAQTANAEPSAKKQSMWSLILKGGIVMIPLGICSVVGLAVAIERSLSLRRTKIIPPNFIGGLMEQLESSGSNPKAAMEFCENSRSPVGNIFRAGIQSFSKGEDAVERAIEDAGSREVDKMKRSLQSLFVITSVSPLFGLLGTVFGMIKSFEVASVAGTGKSELLARGIYEALVTTASGLAIAISALLLYHYFSTRINAIVDEIDQMGLDFMNHINFEESDRHTAASPTPAGRR
jgi:biopolymer transport protein ExbB